MKYKSDFMNLISERGLLYQCTDPAAVDGLLSKGKPESAYWGTDPTADALHVGHLASFSIMRFLQKTGHRPIILIGGATGLIGDPSGKDSGRPLMDAAVMRKNMAGIKKSLSRFFRFGDGPGDALLVNNYDWTKDVKYLDFLRDYGRHFSVNEMIKKDSVRLRLEREQPMSFLEFNYSLLQAYDFVTIYRLYGARLQVEGADQWGNIVAGVELGRRLGLELYGLTNPLITDSSGKKFGKSAGNAVWLDEEKTSNHDYYQFWRNVDDRDVGRMLRVFTDLPIPEIARLEKLKGAEVNEAKKILAFEATRICRGEAAAKSASATAAATFEQKTAGDDLPSFPFVKGESVIDAFVRTRLAASKSEAKRLLSGGGLYIGGEKVQDAGALVPHGAEPLILSAGKKSKAVLKP